MRYLFLLLFSFFLSVAVAQTIHPVSFAQLQQRVAGAKDSIVILNFWATWCNPCVGELPYFEELNQKYTSKKIKVILVNLDFNSKIKTVAEPFVKNKNLKSIIL